MFCDIDLKHVTQQNKMSSSLQKSIYYRIRSENRPRCNSPANQHV